MHRSGSQIRTYDVGRNRSANRHCPIFLVFTTGLPLCFQPTELHGDQRLGCVSKLTPRTGLGLGGDEQTMLGHHRSNLEGHHLHRFLRRRARGLRHEQRNHPLHDVTDPASQNDSLLQQRTGERQAVPSRDLDA